MKRLSIGGAIACAIFALAFFNNLARAGSGGQELVCMEYRNVAGDVMVFRHRGFSQEQVIGSVRDELPKHFRDRVKSVIEEGYKWPRGDEDFRVYVFLECVKNRWQSSAVADQEVSAPSPQHLHHVKSQKFACENIAATAEHMEWEFKNTEIRPEHYVNHGVLARLVARCMKDKEVVRACVMRYCMGQPA